MSFYSSLIITLKKEKGVVTRFATEYSNSVYQYDAKQESEPNGFSNVASMFAHQHHFFLCGDYIKVVIPKVNGDKIIRELTYSLIETLRKEQDFIVRIEQQEEIFCNSEFDISVTYDYQYRYHFDIQLPNYLCRDIFLSYNVYLSRMECDYYRPGLAVATALLTGRSRISHPDVEIDIIFDKETDEFTLHRPNDTTQEDIEYRFHKQHIHDFFFMTQNK